MVFTFAARLAFTADHEPGKFQGRNQSTRSLADLDSPQGKLGIGMNDAFPVR